MLRSESTWSIPGPLDHAQTPSLHLLPALREVVFSGTLDVCRAFFSDGKVDAVGEAAPANSTSLRGGRAGGDVDPVETPDLVTEDDPRSQASHPSDGLLPGAGGNLPRRDSARNGRESREGLEGVREHPHQPAVQPAVSDDEAWGNWRASSDLRRPVTPPRRPVTPPKQPLRQKAKVEPSPVLQPPMPVPAEASPLPAPAEAPPLGVPLPIQPPLPPPSTAAPTYSWTPTPAPRVGAVYSTPSGQSYRVREELGLLSEAEKEAWQIALNQARQVRPRVASRSLPMPPPAPQRYTVPPPPAPTGSTTPAATGLFEFYDHPMESSARLWQLASPASGSKGAASGSLKDHAVPKGQLIARHSAGAALPPREPKPVYASCAESLPVGLAPHVICSACGSSVAVAAPVQDANMKNNQEPDTRHRDPAAGLGLAADQGELFLSSDPETRRELHKRLSHVSQGHVPYWANCEACNRSRGLTPARMRGDRPEKEYQVDQFMYRSRCFIILVHVLAFAVAVTFRPEGMSGREASTYLEPWLAHFGLSRRGDTKPSFYSDPEPLTINIAQALAERYEGHSESFAPERHAPVAERAVRTLKGIVSSHELQLRENGVVLGDDPGTLEFLFRYAAHVHNRFAVSVGSTMSPLQKLRGHDHKPQLTYPFGAVVFAKVSRSSKEEVDAKYARGVYLGPVLGSTGHQVRIRLDSGETKLIVAPGLKLLYPLRYDASLLDGAKALEGFVPPLDEERFRELHLPYVPGGGPSKEWVREHGGTPRCPGCSEEATSSRHSVRCVRRYQRWLRDAVDNALEELDRDPPPAQGPPAKRVRFGDSEVREFSAPSAPSEGEVEVPQIDAEANDHLSDYEPSLPSEDEGEDDLMGVAEAPKDDRPAIRLLEELWACGCVRYVPTPLTACDVYDLQAFCSLLVDGRSSCDKLPYSCIASLGNVEHEHVEHDVGRLSLGVPVGRLSLGVPVGRSSVSVPVGRSSVGVPVGRSSVSTSVGRSGVSMSVGRSDQSACNGQDQEREGAYMPIGDRWVWVSRPRVSYDDIDGIQLDNKESWEGMKTEVKAVDSLQVGLLRSRSEVDHYQAENPGCRVIKSRWVLTQKAPGLVRARLVAKDFAHGRPSALDLGLSSNTASVEALKLILSRAAKGRMRIWGLDISTAFLFANVVQPTVVELPSSFCLEGGGTAYLILEKALYGLRSASLSWQRHLSKIMVGLGLKASPLEPTLFSGWVQLGQKWTYIIALAYVDDLLIVSDSQEGVEFIHKSLSAVLKVKVTGRLHEDGQLEFLGRLIKLDGNNITLGVKPEYVRSVFSAFGWTEKDLAKIKPVATTPDIRALYDAEDPESPSPSLSAEAAGRFRSCLGKIGWLTQTRTDITYFHSMLSRGQAAPRMVHEDALRKFLRWFVGCPLLDQIFPAGNGETLEEEGATLVAFCDSNWGSESSTGRKSTSGGVIYVVAGSLWFCVKGYSRLQTVVALSSAEAELFAIAEAAKEIAGLGQLASHIWGELTKPLAIYTDSASARQIAGMEGFLRRMRHVDIRLCFIQDRVHQHELVINGVPGEENVSDLLTKNLNRPQTLKHTTTLGLEDIHQVDLCAVPVVRSCVFLAGLLNSIFDNTELEWERFLGLCELPTSYGTLLVEFCTDPRSSFVTTGCDYSVFVLPVTLEVDGTSPETVERLISAMDVARSWGMKVVLWSSTPCTGGSPWQRKHLHHNPQHQEHLQALFTVHRKLWKSWLKLNTHPQVSVWVMEWPQRCSYWGWQSTKSFLRSRSHHEGLVHGCMAGMVGQDNLLVKKTWKLVSNDADFFLFKSCHELLHVMVAMIIHKRLTSRLHSTIREPLQRLLWLHYGSDEFTSRQVQLEELC